MSDTTKILTSISIQTTIEIPIIRIRHLLCGAFEGGSNYWYMIEGYTYPPGTTKKDFSENGKMQDPINYFPRYLLVPTTPGGEVHISDVEGDESDSKKFTLNLTTIQSGLQIMATKYPHHFADFLQENDDAETSDVFLQCCLFNEIIYG